MHDVSRFALRDKGCARLWPLSREALSKQFHNFDWRLLSLLVLALLVRVAAIIEFPSLHHPDENFQLLEQGHRYFFGTGLVPWEFSVGTRSPVLPFLLGLVFAAAEPLVGGPEGYIFVARLLLALSSLAGVVAVYRMGQRVSPTHAVLGGLVTATWFEFVYFAGRPLTEAVATTVLLVGLSLASVSERELTGKRLILYRILFCFVSDASDAPTVGHSRGMDMGRTLACGALGADDRWRSYSGCHVWHCRCDRMGRAIPLLFRSHSAQSFPRRRVRVRDCPV